MPDNVARLPDYSHAKKELQKIGVEVYFDSNVQMYGARYLNGVNICFRQMECDCWLAALYFVELKAGRTNNTHQPLSGKAFFQTHRRGDR